MAEDFSPFNVNVTTVEPAVNDLRKGEVSGDTKWGVRAVVTIETTTVRCGCGGIAYIGSFNDLYDEPVFIYNSSESGVAEAISHEVGHSLYLAHDSTKGADLIAGTSDDVEYYAGHGSGNTSWAPIMGSSYNRNVTTWDAGEFYNAKNVGASANYNNGPDDLEVMATKNGFTYRADDHGGTIATATPLTVSGSSVSGSGIIRSRTDVDMFAFTTGAGIVTLNIQPATLRPNMDILANLYDAAGNLISTSNPVDALNAAFSLSLASGSYYLSVDGVGFGTPSSSTPTGYTDYASIGQFSISGTIVDPGSLPQLSVSDVVVSEAAGSAQFVVQLNGTITQDVTVSYSTSNGSATVVNDYSAATGMLLFTPGGSTTQMVSVGLVNDSTSEASETFNLVLQNPSANALIADAIGTATVNNDDASLSIGDTTVTEGNVSRKGVVTFSTAVFTVTLAHPVDRAVSVAYSTAPGTATANVDYQSKSSSLVISTGQTSGSIPITVVGDNTTEPNETFFAQITSADPVTDNSGTATIIDNDSGKGGGPKNGPAAANYPGDYTIIDHTDLSESLYDHMAMDHHHDHAVLGSGKEEFAQHSDLFHSHFEFGFFDDRELLSSLSPQVAPIVGANLRIDSAMRLATVRTHHDPVDDEPLASESKYELSRASRESKLHISMISEDLFNSSSDGENNHQATDDEEELTTIVDQVLADIDGEY